MNYLVAKLSYKFALLLCCLTFTDLTCLEYSFGILSLKKRHPRREAWLDRLSQLGGADESMSMPSREENKWAEKDWKYIKFSSDLAFLSSTILKEEMR